MSRYVSCMLTGQPHTKRFLTVELHNLSQQAMTRRVRLILALGPAIQASTKQSMQQYSISATATALKQCRRGTGP
eukprot:14337-Heterococcus_DN1.PRE.1